jgi:group I intron endonuclease
LTSGGALLEELERIVSSEEDRRWCVYIHRNNANNKAYIGIAANTQKRWGIDGKNYLAQHADGSYEHPVFAKALMKYKDWENDWEHIIFQENLTQAEAKHIEVLLIALFQTNCSRYKNPECGYNLTDGGEGISGYIFSDESKNKLSQSQKKRFENPENHPMYGVHRYGEENPMYGKHHTEETKQIIGAKTKERQSNPENCPMYGKHFSEEAKIKMREAKIGVYDGENHPMYGKHHSDESKKKISDSKSGYNAKNTLQVININTNKIYHSAAIAGNDTGIDSSAILKCCKGNIKTSGGYIWKYIYDYTMNDGTVIPGAITLGIITEEDALIQLTIKKGE